jgi:hypothetical protein
VFGFIKHKTGVEKGAFFSHQTTGRRRSCGRP